MDKPKKNDSELQKKEDDIMPTLELMEPEKVILIDEMSKYFETLKKMNKDEAIETSRKNLLDTGIIDESGNLTERYKFSRDNQR